jgi:hypothetical protein
MGLIFVGALLVLGGVMFLAAQPVRRGQLSGGQLRSAHTLEPRRPALGFGARPNWPGLAMVVLGAALLLGGAVF